MNAEVDDVLDFLTSWKTREQLREKFDMSNTESYRYLRWLVKGGYIVRSKTHVSHHTNKCWVYKKK